MCGAPSEEGVARWRVPHKISKIWFCFPERERPAENRLLNLGLVCEQTVETLVAHFGVQGKVGVSAEFQRDVLAVALAQQHRDKPLIHSPGIVKKLLNELAFVGGAKAHAGLFIAIRSPPIGFSAYHQDELRAPNLALHPLNPAARRKTLVLVQDGIDAVTAQPVGERQDLGFVRGRVVAIADEDLRGRHRLHPS